MKTVLAIDTSTLTASVAVVAGTTSTPRILAEAASGVDSHSTRLLALIDEALVCASLKLTDIDGIAVGAGPGSFTGLRIGMATAKGLAFAADRPLWAVSSLAALALDSDTTDDLEPHTLVIPILDARRKEIFVGFYQAIQGLVLPAADESVIAPAQLREAVERTANQSSYQRILALGDGLSVHAAELGNNGTHILGGLVAIAANASSTPPARAVGRIVLAGDHPDVLVDGKPAYIRLSEAEIKFPQGNPGGTFASRK